MGLAVNGPKRDQRQAGIHLRPDLADGRTISHGQCSAYTLSVGRQDDRGASLAAGFGNRCDCRVWNPPQNGRVIARRSDGAWLVTVLIAKGADIGHLAQQTIEGVAQA